MRTAQDGRILFLVKALVSLLFLSKISFGSVLPIPQSFSFLIFQKGMHPFVNVFLCFLFGIPLALLGLKVRNRNHLSGFYKIFVLLLVLTLTVQTLLQIHYVNANDSFLVQLAALLVSLAMIFIYGVLIPSLWSVSSFISYVQRWSGVLVILSLVLWVLAGGSLFKGGRFIGIFKHIPHMVTCATVAFIFSLGPFLDGTQLKNKIWNGLVLAASFIAIVMTGTRSSAAAVLIAFLLMMILHKVKSNQGRIFKVGFLSLVFVTTIFFGQDTYNFARGIATGQNSLGQREAQDGVASRWEEVERGMQFFLKQPWLGHGLLSKFGSGQEADVSSYNAMKDPHNIFVSAGVIGGWPLLILSGVALIFMTIGSLKALISPDRAKRQVAVYLLAHIPILIIYHVHLSIGGMADRLYWMIFGFVAVSVSVVSSRTDSILNTQKVSR